MNERPASDDNSRESLIYRIAELYLKGDKPKVQDIIDQVNREFPQANLKRESVYPILAEAKKREFLVLVPPTSKRLAEGLAKKYDLAVGNVHVVDCPDPASNEHVSAVAARIALKLVKEVGGIAAGPVGLGLGPGRATRDFSTCFSQLLRQEIDVSRLNLVAISAGCPAASPEYSSVSFFNFFSAENVEQRIGLFAETLVPKKDFADIIKRPGVKEAFEAKEKGKVQIVVTSMGDMDDPHDLFRTFLEQCPGKIRWLNQHRCVGNVQYRPFSEAGPIVEDSPEVLRAVTLFELADLVNMAKQKDHHVILISRRCGACGRQKTRARALRPLLVNPSLRVFSELVVDSATAQELLASDRAVSDTQRSTR